MVERFLKIKEAVAKSLFDLNQIDLFPGEDELKAVEDLVEALEVVETASLALNRDDSELKKAEIVFQFFSKRSSRPGK